MFTKRSNLFPVAALAALTLLSACKGTGGTGPMPGLPSITPSGVHAQFVVVGDLGVPNSLLTFSLGTGNTPNFGNFAPTYNNHSATLKGPFFIFNDFNSNLWAADFFGASVTWYSVTAIGGAPISHTISGGLTTLILPTGVYVSPAGWIYVADTGTHAIDVFAPGSTGNVAPSARIMGGSTTLFSPQGISLDSSGNIWVVDYHTPAIDEFPNVTSGTYSGPPTTQITGAATKLSAPIEMYIDFQKHIWVGDVGVPGLLEFNPTGGNQAPIRDITGASTTMTGGGQLSVAVDNGGYIYEVEYDVPQINIFAPTANGNVAPLYVISGGLTNLVHPSAVLVYSTSND